MVRISTHWILKIALLVTHGLLCATHSFSIINFFVANPGSQARLSTFKHACGILFYDTVACVVPLLPGYFLATQLRCPGCTNTGQLCFIVCCTGCLDIMYLQFFNTFVYLELVISRPEPAHFTLKKSKLARNISKSFFSSSFLLLGSIQVVGGKRAWLLVEAINFICILSVSINSWITSPHFFLVAAPVSTLMKKSGVKILGILPSMIRKCHRPVQVDYNNTVFLQLPLFSLSVGAIIRIYMAILTGGSHQHCATGIRQEILRRL